MKPTVIRAYFIQFVLATLLTSGVTACAVSEPAAHERPRPLDDTATEDAMAFVDSAEAVLYDLGVKAGRAAWIQATYITYDSQILAAETQERLLNAAVALGTQAAQYDHLDLPFEVRRKLSILKQGLTMPAPPDPQKTAELTRISVGMESHYGKGEYCTETGECLELEDLEEIIGNSRNADSLLMAWRGWRTVSPAIKDDYARFVELTNEGARALGFSNTGEMWRSNYDMPANDFAAEMDRLWGQVEPLYTALHCYVRNELADYYGEDVVPRDGLMPAHVLGNMWAQDWENIFEIVAPEDADPGFDLTRELKRRDVSPVEMTRYGERFFTSLGFDPLPATFWERSLFSKPSDRAVVCHASAWNVDEVDDLRIKMCIDPTAEDFQTIHHELGHNFYQRAYNTLPYLYRQSANDGFHEALGDAVALSVTPTYLAEIGLIDEVPPPSKDIGLLLRDALDKVAFLPFGLLIDKWRWQVFSGELTSEEYNKGWWDLRAEYQGIAPPIERADGDFDPGAKYHIPANVPYARYFLAHILQFQFHRALCEVAGFDGPLNRCSIYGSKEAGERLNAMMAMGMSQPWPRALELLTGGDGEMDATAIHDYFAPLKVWLDDQNEGQSCGW